MSGRGSCREKRPGRWELKVYVRKDPITKKKVYAYETVDAAGQREADDKLADSFTGEQSDERRSATGDDG